MIVGIKDVFKMLGIIIVSACAVFVCTLFLNYNLDLISIENQINSEEMRSLFDALVMTGKVVCILSGGCLLLTSVVLLLFYINHYIDTHRKELGILKAIGYSNQRIARGFIIFGFSVFLGTAIGYVTAHCFMPGFYSVQSKDKLLPEVSMHFHPMLALELVILPTLFFAILSEFYGYMKLGIPVMDLLRGRNAEKTRKVSANTNMTFLKDLRKTTVCRRKSLSFFIAFATFCYAAMMQMSVGMKELASEMMSVMIMLIGIIYRVCTGNSISIRTIKNNGVCCIQGYCQCSRI